jgi:cytochrome c1
MPVGFYKALLPRDLDAIVAYLRTVKAVRNQVTDPEYKASIYREPYPDAEAGFSDAEFSNPVIRGKYLATIGHCMLCHSAWSRGISDYKNGLGRGGRPFGPAILQGLPSSWQGSVAANVTSDPTAGIGAWSDDEIKRAIRQRIVRDGHQLQPPMASAYYAGLTDADVADIVAYLRTVPPLK